MSDIKSGELENTDAAGFSIAKHNWRSHWCMKCGPKVLKWGVVLYLLHFVIHAVLFVINPVLGWLSLGAF